MTSRASQVEERIVAMSHMDDDVPLDQFIARASTRFIPQSMSAESAALLNGNWKRLIAELRAARKALQKYGDHDKYCRWSYTPTIGALGFPGVVKSGCTCGLSEALAGSEGKVKDETL